MRLVRLVCCDVMWPLWGQGSIWMGDDSTFKQSLKAKWSEICTSEKMESLDYDIVDNRVFREIGRHRSAVTKISLTFLIGTVGRGRV